MKKKLDRKPKKNIYFKVKNKIICENQSSFCKKNNINLVIKLHPHDFNSINKHSKKITHFNIKSTNSKPGKYYYMIKILKPGFFDGKKTIEPILLGKNFLLVKCLSAENNISYEKINKKFYKNNIGKIKGVENLKKMIKKRYRKTLAHFTDSEKLGLGVGISEFKIERQKIPKSFGMC